MVVTAVMETMRRRGTNGAFGLASADEEQRKACVDYYRHLLRKIDAINTRFPGKIIALEMQAAPQAGNPSVEQATAAFSRSVREITSWDWSCDLVLEHCDAMTGPAPRKGFLPLAQVLEVVKETDISVCINWARSAIEGRNIALPPEHVKAALEAGKLGALMFSGTSVRGAYGEWQDLHAPFSPFCADSLMTTEQVKALFTAASAATLKFSGIKLLEINANANVSHRIAILRDGISEMKKQRNNNKNLIPVTFTEILNMNISTHALQADIPRQRWLRIIPPILIACIISYMDRVNIAFAMPGGMDEELGISATMAGLAGGIFFIGYLFLQVPGGKIAVHGSGKKFIGWSLVAWAVISVLTGVVTNQYQLLALRFLLGVAEGGMLPVVLTMISNWFPDAERGRANAIVIMFVPIAGIITAPLSGWIITALDWRWLFIIEGLMSIVVLVLWVFTVYDRPQEARWISEAEKNYLIQTLAAEQQAIAGKAVKNASLSAVLSDKTMWQLIALNFFYQTGIYGYTLWLPTILKELTHTSIGQVGMLAILPYVGAIAGMFLFSSLSDRTGKRKLFVSLPLIGFALCMFLSVALKENIWLAYAALVGCGFFLQSAAGVFWTIPARLFSAEMAGGARGVINALGNLGGFCGPYAVGVLITLYSKDAGVYCLAVSLALASLLALMLPAKCDAGAESNPGVNPHKHAA